MLLRSEKSVSVVLGSRIASVEDLIPTSKASNLSLPRFNCMPQQSVLRTFSDQDE